MTAHPVQLAKGPHSGAPISLLNSGTWDVDRLARSLQLFHPQAAEIDGLYELARKSLPGIASKDVVERVFARHPEALWAIRRQGRAAGPAEGFIVTLPLSKTGRRQLAEDTFDALDPDARAIAAPGTRAAAIYIWALYAPGRLISAVPLLLSGPDYCDLDIVARAATAEGARLAEALGLKANAYIDGIRAPHLFFLERTFISEGDRPAYDTYRPGLSGRTVSVTVVNSIEQLHRVLTIRAAVFMAEQACPYDEEFDGNDFCGNHLLGYVGREPAGCARIRYFAGFAKIERVAVRAEFRYSRLAFELGRAAVELCRKKGYRTLYCHSQKRWARLWSRFGFRPYDGGQEFTFSDFDYVEMIAQIEADEEAISLGAGPYVLLRPEGHWDREGILECSAERGSATTRVSELQQ